METDKQSSSAAGSAKAPAQEMVSRANQFEPMLLLRRRAALHLTCWSKTCVFWATRGTRWKQTEPKRLRRSSSSAFTIHKALPPPRLRCPMANWGSSDFGCHVRVIEETGAEESSCPVQSGRWAWPTEGGRETLGEGNWRLQVVRSKLWRRVGTSPHGRLR
ncbi:unnamed protein product [Prorocentrum cordatum]|uniref:Uncharacterized protein n=1 Tax=Prorocentrum cordatum TaxID=2364126 RepID=A0ABN9RBI4_9DINO|nr:unnamed protein product [Polarella glacialis]